jgi:hypothetical protein
MDKENQSILKAKTQTKLIFPNFNQRRYCKTIISQKSLFTL